ncbi:MAG: DUF971 domain-containing protein [Planctomycetaceae bacterium]|nr:DUF971 domain-containing protein [Planctomycetaceae bacterium]
MKPPTKIQASREAGCLTISWPDGHEWSYPCKYLRESCRCAQCVHEITGELLLDPDSIPASIRIDGAKLVGNYALKIIWSDGHDTGLYTWSRLRELCCCSKCQTCDGPNERDD